jgi:hypothetical protein
VRGAHAYGAPSSASRDRFDPQQRPVFLVRQEVEQPVGDLSSTTGSSARAKRDNPRRKGCIVTGVDFVLVMMMGRRNAAQG